MSDTSDAPVPILLSHIGNEPRDLLAVEDDLVASTRLDEPIGVHEVTVKLETCKPQPKPLSRYQKLTSVVKDKVNSAILDCHNVVGKLVQVIPENVLLRCGQSITTGRLKLLDVLLGHVDKKRQIGGVTPQTNCY